MSNVSVSVNPVIFIVAVKFGNVPVVLADIVLDGLLLNTTFKTFAEVIVVFSLMFTTAVNVVVVLLVEAIVIHGVL